MASGGISESDVVDIGGVSNHIFSVLHLRCLHDVVVDDDDRYIGNGNPIQTGMSQGASRSNMLDRDRDRDRGKDKSDLYSSSASAVSAYDDSGNGNIYGNSNTTTNTTTNNGNIYGYSNDSDGHSPRTPRTPHSASRGRATSGTGMSRTMSSALSRSLTPPKRSTTGNYII